MSEAQAPTPDPAVAPPRIQFSRTAVDKVREMLVEEDLLEEGGLRISARFGAGCSTPLQFDLVLETEPEPGDLVLAAGGVRILVAPDHAWSLDGLQVDYVDSPVMGSGFAFRHPRGVGGRSCSR